MKTNDLLIYGGLAIGAYFLLIKKPAATPLLNQEPAPVLPAAVLQPINQGSPIQNIINTAGDLIKNIIPTPPAPVVAHPAQGAAPGAPAQAVIQPPAVTPKPPIKAPPPINVSVRGPSGSAGGSLLCEEF